MNSKILSYTEGQECNLCNGNKITVSINTIHEDVLIICIECLKEIIKKMHKLKSYEI